MHRSTAKDGNHGRARRTKRDKAHRERRGRPGPPRAPSSRRVSSHGERSGRTARRRAPRRAAASVFRRARRGALGERSGPTRRKRNHPHTERQQGRKCRRSRQSWKTQPRSPSRAPQKEKPHEVLPSNRGTTRVSDRHGLWAQARSRSPTRLHGGRRRDLLTPHSETSFRTRTGSTRDEHPQGTPLKTPKSPPARLTENWKGKRARPRHRTRADGRSRLPQQDTGFSLPVPSAHGPGMKSEAWACSQCFPRPFLPSHQEPNPCHGYLFPESLCSSPRAAASAQARGRAERCPRTRQAPEAARRRNRAGRGGPRVARA